MILLKIFILKLSFIYRFYSSPYFRQVGLLSATSRLAISWIGSIPLVSYWKCQQIHMVGHLSKSKWVFRSLSVNSIFQKSSILKRFVHTNLNTCCFAVVLFWLKNVSTRTRSLEHRSQAYFGDASPLWRCKSLHKSNIISK